MRIRIAPLSRDLLPAARALNARLGPAAPFFLPEKLSSWPAAPASNSCGISAISWTHCVALEDAEQGAEARGGFLLMDQPAWIAGETRAASNSQSMLSEGLRDRRYGMVSVHMLKYIEQHSPYAFMVGMGNAQNPLPRLLRAAGWTLRPVPFFFRVYHARNFLREMRPLRQNRFRRMVARVAALSGVGRMGIRLLQARPAAGALRGVSVDPVGSWGPWADEFWERYRTDCSFAVVRDRSTLDLLYPLAADRLTVALIRQGAAPRGWAAWLNTPMQNDQYFGNLRVATILDCVAVPGFAELCARAVASHLEQSGADVAIANHSHFLWTLAFRKAGFLRSPSNYLLATSKPLSAAILAGGGEQRIHLTRGDGDGRIHL
jgi:hypothetical protein